MVKNIVIGFWIFVAVFLVVTYFFFPDVFWQLFSYPGAGGPFVNTPTG